MRRSSLFVILFLFLLGVLYSLLSVFRHLHFQSGAFDLGIYDQAIWQYAHFLYPFNTVKMQMILGDHLTLTLPFLAPLYWIWDNVVMLLIFQAFWTVFSGWPLYLYFEKRGLTTLQSFLLVVLYVLFNGIQFAIDFDFHPLVIALGLGAWMVYFWETKQWKFFGIFTALFLLTQENMGIALCGLAALWFFQGERRKMAIFMGIIGIVYSFIAFHIVTIFSTIGYEYIPHFPLSPEAFITQFFDTQSKRDVWLYAFSWYSFLPLFSPGALIAVIGDLAQYFITGASFSRYWTPFTHHRAILSIFLVIGTADILFFFKRYKKVPLTPILILMTLFSFGVNYYFHFPINKLSKKDYYVLENWTKDNNFVIGKIGNMDSIATQQSLVPHLSHRQEIYLLYPHQHHITSNLLSCGNTCWWLDFAGHPTYLLVDTHPAEWATMTLTDSANFQDAIDNMEKTGVIEPVLSKGKTLFYRVNYQALHQVL